jgi:diguanylate cyclase (GGDEF)-like protein
MSRSQLLLTVVLLQQTLLCGVWLISARLRLSTRAAWHWAGSAAVLALAMALILSRGTLPDLVSISLSNWMLGAGTVLLRRGVQCFLRVPRRDREHLVVLGGSALAYLLLQGAGVLGAIVVNGAVLGWTLLRLTQEMLAVLMAEYDPEAARWCALVPGVAGAVFGLRGLLAPMFPAALATSVVDGSGPNTAVVFVGMTLSLVLNLMLVALVILRLVTRLRHQSNHDPLTGLLGRRPLQDQLARAAEQRLAGAGCAMLSVDIDHFKQINDRYGHHAGDAVLVRVAQALKAASREGDSVARTGGEEFCLLLPGADRDDARRIAQRLLEAVRALQHPELEPGAVVTVSIGLATLGGEEPPEQLLRRVDRALYGAKRAGRDRIQVAETRPGALA